MVFGQNPVCHMAGTAILGILVAGYAIQAFAAGIQGMVEGIVEVMAAGAHVVSGMALLAGGLRVTLCAGGFIGTGLHAVLVNPGRTMMGWT